MARFLDDTTYDTPGMLLFDLLMQARGDIVSTESDSFTTSIVIDHGQLPRVDSASGIIDARSVDITVSDAADNKASYRVTIEKLEA